MNTLWNDQDEEMLVRGMRSLADTAPPYREAMAGGCVPTEATKRGWRLAVVVPALATAAIVVGAVATPRVLSEDDDRMGPTEQPGFAESGPADPPSSAELPSPEVDAVREAARPLATLEQEPGFGRVALDFDTGTITVYWKDEPPQAVLDQLGTTSDGVRVELVNVSYSQAELVAAGERVLTNTGQGTGLPVVFLVRPQRDLSGVVVEMERADLEPAQLTELEDIAGVPVSVVPGQPLMPQ